MLKIKVFFISYIMYPPPDNFAILTISNWRIKYIMIGGVLHNMKRFFEEHTAVIIICIVVSLLLCIIGCINNINEDGAVAGKGLLKIAGDN